MFRITQLKIGKEYFYGPKEVWAFWDRLAREIFGLHSPHINTAKIKINQLNKLEVWGYYCKFSKDA